ncbi:MAG: hypothetical protein A2026_14205 [Deltaproteobacteria bacterium RBG_19FT_COMBO_46_12]|nr:MAG: hypothetical protein A2026_14205 [Deltaproteobacteria bacterium RBG_19FT_COMBO_46_12]
MKKYLFFLNLFLFLLTRLNFSFGAMKEFCLRRLKKNPLDYHARFLLAGFYRSQGDNTAAIREYNFLIQQGHKNPIIVYGLAMATFKEGMIDDSHLYFKMFLDMDRNNKVALDHLGRINLIKENYSKAISFFERSLALDPSSPLISENIAYCYYKTGNFESAYKSYQQAFVLNPSPDLEEKLNSVRRAIEMSQEEGDSIKKDQKERT